MYCITILLNQLIHTPMNIQDMFFFLMNRCSKPCLYTNSTNINRTTGSFLIEHFQTLSQCNTFLINIDPLDICFCCIILTLCRILYFVCRLHIAYLFEVFARFCFCNILETCNFFLKFLLLTFVLMCNVLQFLLCCPLILFFSFTIFKTYHFL